MEKQHAMSVVRAAASAEYLQFVEDSRRVTAIDLRAYKPKQMERRIRSLMARKRVASFAQYTDLLRAERDERLEFERYVTINVTQFYRDPGHFSALEQALRKRVGEVSGPLQVWSAGCSNGSEPYTVAMILATLAPGVAHEIHATDIDAGSLEQARLGCGYSNDLLATLPPQFRSRYLMPDTDGNSFAVVPRLKSMVTFSRHDLIKDRYRRGFDLILCRNVVIYFSNETKLEIFNEFYQSLNPGGLLFIGATEMLTGLRDIGFAQLGHGLYQRPQRSHISIGA